MTPKEKYEAAVRRRQRREMVFWATVSLFMCLALGGLLWLMI